MHVNSLIVEDREIVDADIGAIECALPAAFCHPAAMRVAQQEGVSLLQWWRDLGADRGVGIMGSARTLIERLTPDVVRAKAEALVQPVFAGLLRVRQNLDASKPIRDTTDAAGGPSAAALAWGRLNAEWYATMGALANGIHLSDSETGELVLPEGAEVVFGDEYLLTDAVVATEWDGIDFGALLAQHIENDSEEDVFGGLQLLLGVFFGLLALAIVVNITNWTDNAVIASAHLKDAAKDLDKLTIKTQVQPLGGAGGAIIALALVVGTVAFAAKVQGKELKLPRRN